MMMSFESNKNVLIFLLSSIGLIALPHINHVPKAVFIFFYLILGWRFAGIWKKNWLPNAAATFILTLLGLALLYVQHQGILGRDAGTNLFMIALALKLMEIKKERDIYLINYLAFIVAASQFLFEQSILMAAYILLVSCALLATLTLINSRHLEILPALKIAGTIIVQAIPVAIVIFIFFPRVEAPRWMWFTDKNEARAGLSDYMEPGSISNLGLSDELVFRVKFSGSPPPPHFRYWRGPVMSHTDGKRWTPTKHSDFQKNIPEPSVTDQPYRYTLLMEPQNKNWVFALDMPTEYPTQLSRNADYQLLTSENPEKRAEYKITSYPEFNSGLLTRADYQKSTQLPEQPSSEIILLAKHLRGFDAPPEVFIKQLLNHFRTENFRYTLSPPLLEENPIETFLFETRSGFCSHYASAFVYLMRVAKIPARVVTGYQGGEMNEVGQFLEIRQKDAHAWAEVWLENKGWVRFDPTAAIAPERIERSVEADQLVLGGEISFDATSVRAKAAFNWLRQARQLWNSVDYNWQRWVINYNSINQSKFLSSFGINDVKTMVYWMAAITAIITALLSAFLFVQKPRPTDKSLLLYKKYCKKLAKRGFTRSAGEGAMDFAQRIKARLPEHSTEIDRITTVFIKLRYGRDPTREDLRQLNRMICLFKI
jgi:transglutaminase-like putative cysteine protease